MNISSLIKLALLVMQVRGASLSSDTFDPDYMRTCFVTQEAGLREFVALTSDPNAANNLSTIKGQLRITVRQLYEDYRDINAHQHTPQDNSYIVCVLSREVLQFPRELWPTNR